MKLTPDQTTKNSNMFMKRSFEDELETSSNFSSSSFQTLTSKNKKKHQINESMKSDRKARCQEALKMKHLM